MEVVLEGFQKVLVAVEADMYHDAVGYPDCCVQYNWEYCRHSHFHPQHCQGHSTLSSQRIFKGAQLTQLVLLVTASRLFLGHKGQVDP